MVNEKENSSEKNIDHKIIEFQEKGIHFLEKSVSEVEKIETFGSQELTLSYLCENSKLGFQEKVNLEKNLLNSVEKMSNYKGKEVMVSEDLNEESERWVERDFLQLNEKKGNLGFPKREAEKNEEENREKKPKIETFLSLALPDVSLSLAGSNRIQNGDLPANLWPSRSIEPSNNNTRATWSNDFTANSLSCSFSHNPSCSITHNSTENYDYSVGSRRTGSDRIWNAGEGTNGSVHSRFRPIGDGGVTLSNHVGGSFNSIHRTTSSDNNSFFPSELPARPRIDGQSRGSGNLRRLENIDGGGGRTHKVTRPERILREIVSESIPLMAQIVQELPDEMVESTKVYLRSLIATPERKDELISLQNRLDRRSDLTNQTLSKCHKIQLELLVAIKTGLGSFLSQNTRLPTEELVEVFLLERCRNVNCKRLLPVEDCDCKICSTKKGFCSECMCPVCLNFDCASNTCSWVGCDACSHWCHAVCGIGRNLIKPGPSFKGPSGTTEMQFYCLGCGHASEMFGFVKDVFMSCAEQWGEEALMKELDCVRKIFQGSEDLKGKELHVRADNLRTKLAKKMISPSDACNFIFQFFSGSDGLSDFSSSNFPSTDFSKKSAVTDLPASTSLIPKSAFYNTSSSSGRKDTEPADHRPNDVNTSFAPDKMIEDEWSVKPSKKDELDCLESIVRIKQAEAQMFQSRADDARGEAGSLRQLARLKSDKLEEEYSEKLNKLGLQGTEERRRKKLEELKTLENSHCDYCKMKMRMHMEIAGLLNRMEAAKQLWV
ncbi:protein OBERON 3 [Lycium barbarum]|uniref:protein OBERON 3 n=1 Tax=Lycium barbarum TaxID=112863 RepID=UPI00293F266C|nr:protein OBERON 3 [Lycium barbarum]